MKNTFIKTAKFHVLTLILCLFSIPILSQNNNSSPSDFWNHVRFGGGGGRAGSHVLLPG